MKQIIASTYAMPLPFLRDSVTRFLKLAFVTKQLLQVLLAVTSTTSNFVKYLQRYEKKSNYAIFIIMYKYLLQFNFVKDCCYKSFGSLQSFDNELLCV